MSDRGGRPIDEVTVTEAIVVGAGVAGLRAALAAAPREVTLLTAGQFARGGSSPLAQGGVAAALAPPDTPGQHASDTLVAAAGIANPAAVELLTRQGPREIEWLAALGARFDRHPDGRLALAREAAHGRARIVHAGGDATGAELMRVLAERVRKSERIRVVEHTIAVDLARTDGRVIGVIAAQGDGRLVLHLSRAVVLASGGIGGIYSHTTNPPQSRGDGLAMAARAGATLADLEFVQFHPTALAVGGNPLPLLTEALRGAGARLVDARGEPLMEGVHPDGDLAPRDVVARAVWRRLELGETVYLDIRRLMQAGGRESFPTALRLCEENGVDARSGLLPVTPAAHFHMGGVWTDDRGRTSVPGLWACGEVACTGVHGANRLASNSLLEALVFGGRVGEDLRHLQPAAEARTVGPRRLEEPRQFALPRPGLATIDQQLRHLLWSKVGLVRDRCGLEATLERLKEWSRQLPAAGPLPPSLLVSQLVTRAALARRESRGAHFRRDYPACRADWKHSLFVRVTEAEDSVPELEVWAGVRESHAAASRGGGS